LTLSEREWIGSSKRDLARTLRRRTRPATHERRARASCKGTCCAVAGLPPFREARETRFSPANPRWEDVLRSQHPSPKTSLVLLAFRFSAHYRLRRLRVGRRPPPLNGHRSSNGKTPIPTEHHGAPPRCAHRSCNGTTHHPHRTHRSRNGTAPLPRCGHRSCNEITRHARRSGATSRRYPGRESACPRARARRLPAQGWWARVYPRVSGISRPSQGCRAGKAAGWAAGSTVEAMGVAVAVETAADSAAEATVSGLEARAALALQCSVAIQTYRRALRKQRIRARLSF